MEDRTKVFHTVGSALYFLNGETGIFIDGIHKGRDYGFSDTPKDIIDKCQSRKEPFDALKALVFTHRHIDHFYEDDVREIVKRNNLLLYAPQYEKTNVEEKAVEEGVSEIRIGQMRIFAIRTVHDGDLSLSREPHVSFAINVGDESFFVAGDAALKTERVEQISRYILCKNKAVFANPYQLIARQSRELLTMLAPEKIIMAHIPFECDQNSTIKRLVNAAKKCCARDGIELSLPEHNSWIL